MKMLTLGSMICWLASILLGVCSLMLCIQIIYVKASKRFGEKNGAVYNRCCNPSSATASLFSLPILYEFYGRKPTYTYMNYSHPLIKCGKVMNDPSRFYAAETPYFPPYRGDQAFTLDEQLIR